MKLLFVAYDNSSYLTYFQPALGYLAAACRNAGHEVSVYQQDVYHWPDSHLVNHLDTNQFDAVILSVSGGYYQYKKLLQLSKAINSSYRRERIKYLIGGHGPAACPELFLRKTGADVIGIGEGEKTIVELLNVLQNEGSLQQVDGIAFLAEDNKCVITKRRKLIENIDTIAFPAYDLFEMNYYALMRAPNIQPTDRLITMLSARGCPYKCNFCYRLDKGYRVRSPLNILEEIKYLRNNYNFNYFSFADELLMGSVSRTHEICDAFLDSGLQFKWLCNGRLNFAKKDILQKMKKAGCVFINYGIESLDNDTLKIMHKGLTEEVIRKGVQNTLDAGISPGLNFIYGNIDEPLTAIDRAVEFLQQYDDHAQMRTIRPVTPYPGSELFSIAVEKGLLRDAEDFYESKHKNSDLLSVNFTKHSDEEIYEALYRANMELINHHYDLQKTKMEKVCKNLYHERNADFRGFR